MTRKTRKTHKMRKVLLAVCCAALLVCVTIGATVAYLTSTDEVVNTFTVGNVQITLDEAQVNPDGTKFTVGGIDVDRVKKNSYKLLPGHTYTKDPTIHVDANSEDCWLFVKVENGIADIEAATNTIAAQMATNGWTKLNDSNIYYYNQKVVSSTTVTNVPVFGSFKISDAVVGGMKPVTTDGVGDDGKLYLDEYKNAQIVITAYAIQADGFNSAAAAWAAAGSSFTA